MINKEKVLFILGNGFDIAHGLKSQYVNFKQFLIKKFPNVEKICNRQFYIEDFEKISNEEFAAEVLVDAMNKASDINWSNFEEALSKISFDHKLPKRSARDKELDIPEDIQGFLIACAGISNIIVDNSFYWQQFFTEWINIIDNKTSSLTENQNFTKLLNSFDSKIISFNYTLTAEKVYGAKNVMHIHNKIGQKLILGHGEKDVFYDSGSFEGFMSSDLDDFINSLYKDTSKQIIRRKAFFNNLSSEITKVYSIGFSFGKADNAYIKKIIKEISPNAEWVFSQYESTLTKEIGMKKSKLRKYGFKGSFGVCDM